MHEENEAYIHTYIDSYIRFSNKECQCVIHLSVWGTMYKHFKSHAILLLKKKTKYEKNNAHKIW